jgi:anti-sigma factor RsiW
MDRIKYLLLRYLREEITPVERAELEVWLRQQPANRALLEELQDVSQVAEGLAKLEQLHREDAWERVEAYGAAQRDAGVRRPGVVRTLGEEEMGRNMGVGDAVGGGGGGDGARRGWGLAGDTEW